MDAIKRNPDGMIKLIKDMVMAGSSPLMPCSTWSDSKDSWRENIITDDYQTPLLFFIVYSFSNEF